MILSSIVLFPYYLALKLRHRLYDSGILKSEKPALPVVSIGNIAAGGTGKTPMTELAVKLLKDDYRVAVLSRGYGRRSKGFAYVSTTDSSLATGDEPLQIKRKFPDVIVAVDKERTRGLRILAGLPDNERPDIVILDDGFQYRKLRPSKNIVLIDYHRPLFKDNLLPIGRLRDLPGQIKRADCVIVTKAPGFLEEEERARLRHLSHIRPEQTMLAATTAYCKPKAVFEGDGDNRYIYSKEVFFFSGIANDKAVILHLSDDYQLISHKTYADHHKFTRSDIISLVQYAIRHPRTLLLTTEKDAQRLLDNKYLTEDVKRRLFYLPIETVFLTEEEKQSFRQILVSCIDRKEGLPDIDRKENLSDIDKKEDLPDEKEAQEVPGESASPSENKEPVAEEKPQPQDPVYFGPVEPVNNGLLF